MAIDQKGHFRTFSNLAGFLGTIPTISSDAEFNDESIGTNFKSQKRKTKKLECHFLTTLLIYLNKGFFYFSNHFGQLGNFFKVCLKQKN